MPGVEKADSSAFAAFTSKLTISKVSVFSAQNGRTLKGEGWRSD